MPGSLGHWLLDHLNIGDHLELCRFTWTWVSGSLEHGTLWRHEDHSHLQGLTLMGQGGDIGGMGGCGPRSSEPKAHAQASQTPMFKGEKKEGRPFWRVKFLYTSNILFFVINFHD